MSLTDQIDLSRQHSMVGMDIPWMLQEWANRTPDKTSMIWCPFEGEAQQWSYLELQRDALKIAAGLHDRGIKAGDFVFLHMDNSPEFVVSWYACGLLGAVAVSTNTHSVVRDMAYFAEVSDAVCAITQPKFAELIKNSCPQLSFIAVTDNDAGEPRADQDEIIQKIAGLAFDDLKSTTALPILDCDPKRNLSVQFTSGTTSRPKAV